MRAKYRIRLDAEAILNFLEMPREEPSYGYLRRLLVAYRDRVPYETATRLLRYRDIRVPEDRVRYPEEFWREKMTLGAGGSCSDSSYAFKSLLDSLGFDCSMAVNSEGEVERDAAGSILSFPRHHSHCSVIVRLPRGRFVVDPCCGSYIKVPLPLDVSEIRKVEGETEEGRPYRYLVEPLGTVEGEAFYEIHNTGPDGGEYPEKSQAYIFRDRACTDVGLEEHMRFGYREGYSSDHLSFVAGDPETKVEHRFSTRSGRLWRSEQGPWEEVQLEADPAPQLSEASKIPVEIVQEALEYLETEEKS
jgi:hypothetical protein